jgi:hypothetical protein
MSFPPATEMFQFTGFASGSYVFRPGSPIGRGCPIRTSADQRSLASPRGLSQRATSFIASWCQGIHRTPFSYSFTTARTQDPSAPSPTPHEPPHVQSDSSNTETLTHSTGKSAPQNTRYHQLFFTMRNNIRKPRPPTGDQSGFPEVPQAAQRPRADLVFHHLEAIGFEPTTPCLQSRCSTN